MRYACGLQVKESVGIRSVSSNRNKLSYYLKIPLANPNDFK